MREGRILVFKFARFLHRNPRFPANSSSSGSSLHANLKAKSHLKSAPTK